MTKKRRKRGTDEEEIVLITPKAEVEEIVEEVVAGFDSPLMEVFPIKEIESPPPPELPKTRKIEYLGVDILIIRGPITGQRYRFTAKDRISEVTIEDYEGLLKRVRPARKCCGRKAGDPGRTVPSQPYFGPV